jgi:hypothetical protein
MKRKILDRWFDIVFILIVLVSTISAISYFSSDDVFDAKVLYVNNLKNPYSVIISIDSKLESELKYDVEILYKNNLVVGEKSFSCNGNCEKKIIIDKIFFDDYKILISTKVDGQKFEKELNFKLEKPNFNNKIYIKPVYILDNFSSNVNILGKLELEFPSKVILEASYLKDQDIKFKKEINCEKICPFNLTLDKNIAIGPYVLKVYLPNDAFSENFEIRLKTDKSKIIKKDDLNISDLKEKVLNRTNGEKVKVIDILGIEKEMSVENLDNFSNSGISTIVLNSSKIRDNISNNVIKIKPKLKEINNFDDLKKENISLVVEEKKGFLTISNLSKNMNLDPKINPVVYNDSKVYISNDKKYIENISDLNDIKESKKLMPGVYKVENIVRFKDGTEIVETKYFAYGLISINTLKPLYKPNELVEMLIVVLDKRGFLVSNVSINLNITKPDGSIIELSTENLDIVETDKNGVYKVSINSDLVGNYNLYANVELEDMIVDVSSYFNVVEDYSFDILRGVPVTIDPWDGPFRNNFTIIPLNNYKGVYSFTEQFSSDFTNISGNYDKIYTINKTTYLVWENLNGVSKIYYSAQTPLVSPYLYFLGNAYVDYNEGYSRFYENRSWLFAIDPAAKVCGFQSPCYCGAACNNGGEPGDGTIDTCSDGDTNWEFVNDIRVNDLNGSYFGTGDTVEICVDFDCDSSNWGDRVTIAYTDSSSLPWVNSNIIFETICDNTNLNTFCQNVTLSNYVGTHHVRGKIVWVGTANQICSGQQYRDHDDINFTVLERRGANFIQWDLDNGTNIGNNLNVIRGKNITAFVEWDKPIQNAIVTHNGDGIFKNYNILIFNENWTNYTFDTSNISEFSNIGPVNTDITSWDLYFNLSNTTSPQKIFNIYASLKINQSWMRPYVMYNGTLTNIGCQVTDEFLDVPYSNINVSFYNNVSGYLGSSLTNSTGWANWSYIENNIGIYTITCNVSNDLINYFVAGSQNFANQLLTVKINGTDIIPPVVNSVSINPSLFSVGGLTNIKANVTDNINLVSVYINITKPNGISNSYPMLNIGGDLFEFNYTDTVLDGNYKYYIYGFDNSSNKGWSSTFTFTVTGIRTFLGIKTTKDIYKLGEDINLTIYSKVSVINNSVFNELGDVDHYYYTFDTGFEGWTHSGTGDEWQNGIPSSGFNNQCDSGNCLSTDLFGNYNSNSNYALYSPIFNMSGRNNPKVVYWRMLEVYNDADTTHFESYDGSSWNVLFQDTTVPGTTQTLSAGTSTFYPSEVVGVENAQFRFTLTSNGNNNGEGWVVDSFNFSFDPRQDWNKPWIYYNNSFGINENKITAIKIRINVTDYSSIGSESNKNNFPDLEVQIYNGTGYSGNYKCNLDSSKTYPYLCQFVIKNNPEYLTAWRDQQNRSIRIRATNLDHNDYINWTNIYKEYVTPSIIENHGKAQVTSFLLEQFKNSSNGIVKTMYNNSIIINSSEVQPLDIYWNFSVPLDFKLGTYYAYVALTDANGNVLFNDDDGTPINDSYQFQVQSLLIDVINPINGSVQLEDFTLNISLNTTYFASGGWCGYSLDGGANVTMTQKSPTNFDYQIVGLEDGVHNIKFYCNDSDGYLVPTDLIEFNVSQNPRINFVSPTDANNSYVNRSWTDINMSINDTSNTSAFVDFNKTLIGYWNFENASSTTVYDWSTFNNNGIFNNGVFYNNSNGIRGKYGSFDGLDDYIDSNVDFSWTRNDSFSMSVWTYIKGDVNLGQPFISKNNYEYSFFVKFGELKFTYWDPFGADSISIYSSQVINPNRWYHFVITYNGSSKMPKLYIDGVEDTVIFINDITRDFRNVVETTKFGSGYTWGASKFNGSLDEIMIFNRTLSENEIKSLYNSKINQFESNFSNLKNGNYSYYGCAIDTVGNFNCTETRTLNINKTLPKITIISPLNNSKYSVLDDVWFNVTLDTNSTKINNVWFELNNNGTKFYLTNVSLFDWSLNLSLNTNRYNVTFYGFDNIGNLFKSKTHNFLVIPDKNIKVQKEIKSIGNDVYEIVINLKNYGKWVDYVLNDFIFSNYVPYNFSLNYNFSESISGFEYTGNKYSWNLTIPTNNSLNITYFVNASNDYNLNKLNLISID